jgi:hypothetical protein
LPTTRVGEPDAGNLHVRFDEGERLSPRSLLYLLRFEIRCLLDALDALDVLDQSGSD